MGGGDHSVTTHGITSNHFGRWGFSGRWGSQGDNYLKILYISNYIVNDLNVNIR